MLATWRLLGQCFLDFHVGAGCVCRFLFEVPTSLFVTHYSWQAEVITFEYGSDEL
jgi:hypothetical protein